MDLKILRRLWLRNTLWTTIIIIFFFFGLALGKANANSLEQPQSSQKPFKAISVDVWEEKRTAPTTTSTVATTTTTVLVVKPTPKPVNTTPIVSPTADWVTQCHAWASMTGIQLPPSAIKLIERESSCNPSVMNHGGSGAGGIPQALPYTKMGCAMTYTDEAATCQLRWMLNYVNQRYGDWDGALAHSNAKGWY